MSDREIRFIESEIGTLEGFLRELSEDRFIERLGFERRLQRAKQRLAELLAAPRAKSVPITFRGAPVEGTQSIDATFAAKAVESFVEATRAVTAFLASGHLNDRGPLPGVGERSLRIVDTALGSFGFELELPPLIPDHSAQPPLFPRKAPPDPYERAIETTLSLIDEAATQDEEAVSDLVAEMNPRAAKKVRAFVKVLSDHHALFAAEFAGKQVRLDNLEQVQRVMNTLKDEDITEDSETHRGTLLGVLPEARQFEVRLEDGSVIRGKLDHTVEDISAFKAQWENTEAMLHFRVVSVRANRRYMLVRAEPLTTNPPADPSQPDA